MKNILYRVSKNTNGILHRYYTINREVHEKGLLSVHVYLHLSIYLSIYIYVSILYTVSWANAFQETSCISGCNQGEFRGVAQSHNLYVYNIKKSNMLNTGLF